MPAMRTARLELYGSFTNPCARFDDIRPCGSTNRELTYEPKFLENGNRMIGLSYGCYSKTSQHSGFRSSISYFRADPFTSRQLFSFANNNAPRDVVAYYSEHGAGVSNNAVGGDEWITKLKEIWQSTIEAAKYSTEKAKQSSDEITPHVRLFLETHPYLRDVIVPVGSTLAGTLLAWSLLPVIFRRFHKYSIEGADTLLPTSSSWGPIPYESSFWGALEDPVRYFITFLAFLEMLFTIYHDTLLFFPVRC